MKLYPAISPSRLATTRRHRSTQAFTMAEMMVSVSIFMIMALGSMTMMIFGLKWDELVTSKLGATEKARSSFDLLIADIRGCKKWNIGNGNFTSFTALTNQNALKGNAVQVYNDSNITNVFVRYWFDTNNQWLCRMTSGNTNRYSIMAQSLTNASGSGMSFQAQDYNYSNLLDLQYKYVIVTTMEFCQYQYPLTKVGPGNYYDYYRIKLVASSHAPN